jgi:hypothetical protein
MVMPIQKFSIYMSGTVREKKFVATLVDGDVILTSHEDKAAALDDFFLQFNKEQ